MRVRERLRAVSGKRLWWMIVYVVVLSVVIVVFVWPRNRSVAVALTFLYLGGVRYMSNLYVARDRAAMRERAARRDT